MVLQRGKAHESVLNQPHLPLVPEIDMWNPTLENELPTPSVHSLLFPVNTYEAVPPQALWPIGHIRRHYRRGT
jgi:hypothetical protein